MTTSTFVTTRSYVSRHFIYGACFACFSISGFCSLLYQVVWTRLAFAHFGIITPVLSLIVSVFMLGIGIGSVTGGRWARAFSERTRVPSIYFYAATEAFIGVGAFCVPAIFSTADRVLLGLGGGNSGLYLWTSAAYIVAGVLPWSIAMGATIPLMMAFLRRSTGGSERAFSMLYLANVIGGAAGALLEAFVLIELFGIRGTWTIASSLNAAIALLAIAIAMVVPAGSNDVPGPRATARVNIDRTTAAILFTTGFSSLGMEVVWTRAFTFSLHTTIYAFASILAVYLMATALGSQYYRVASLEKVSLGKLLAWIFVCGMLPVFLSDPRLGASPVRTLLSIAPICALLGFLTPMLVDRASKGDPNRAGVLYSINIVGSILGPLTAAYLLLPSLGIRWSAILLCLPLMALAWLLCGGSGTVKRY